MQRFPFLHHENKACGLPRDPSGARVQVESAPGDVEERVWVPLAGPQASGGLLGWGSSVRPRGVGLWLARQAPSRVACPLYLSPDGKSLYLCSAAFTQSQLDENVFQSILGIFGECSCVQEAVTGWGWPTCTFAS